jgi:hypothetical protein
LAPRANKPESRHFALETRIRPVRFLLINAAASARGSGSGGRSKPFETVSVSGNCPTPGWKPGVNERGAWGRVVDGRFQLGVFFDDDPACQGGVGTIQMFASYLINTVASARGSGSGGRSKPFETVSVSGNCPTPGWKPGVNERTWNSQTVRSGAKSMGGNNLSSNPLMIAHLSKFSDSLRLHPNVSEC